MHLILWARKAAVFSAKIEVSIILKMKLSVNEAKLTHLSTRNYVIDFKICLRPPLDAFTRVYVTTNDFSEVKP